MNEKRRFEVIEGGKLENKKTKTKEITEKVEKPIDQELNQFEEYVFFAQRIRRLGSEGFREEVSRFCGALLSKAEAKEIIEKITEGTVNRKRIIEELKEKFPRLSVYFDEILKKINKKE